MRQPVAVANRIHTLSEGGMRPCDVEALRAKRHQLPLSAAGHVERHHFRAAPFHFECEKTACCADIENLFPVKIKMSQIVVNRLPQIPPLASPRPGKST